MLVTFLNSRILSCSLFILSACGGTQFVSSSKASKGTSSDSSAKGTGKSDGKDITSTEVKETDVKIKRNPTPLPIDPDDQTIAALPEMEVKLTEGSAMAGVCSIDYAVPGHSNPFLAGVPDGTRSTAAGHTDRAPSESPLLAAVNPVCLRGGRTLFFSVSGTISHNGNSAGDRSDADGMISSAQSHRAGAVLGKSDIRAPYNSLIGVFLTNSNPMGKSAPPMLSFSTQAERDYLQIKPKIAQIFYIGNGVTSAGITQKVFVPEGATRFYFAIMDTYQWNNNTGSLNGKVLIQK